MRNSRIVIAAITLIIVVFLTGCVVQPFPAAQAAGAAPQGAPEPTAVPSANTDSDAGAPLAWSNVTISPPNVVKKVACPALIAGIAPLTRMGQCIWRTPSPQESRHVWVPAGFIATGGTNGREAWAPCTYAGVHSGLSFTLPADVVLVEDPSEVTWTPPACEVDTTQELNEMRQPVGATDQTSADSVQCPIVAGIQTTSIEDGCLWKAEPAKNFGKVPVGWVAYYGDPVQTAAEGLNLGRQGQVSLYPTR